MFNELINPSQGSMPGVFRIVSTSCLPMEGGKGVTYRIELYHEKVKLAVTFSCSKPDMSLRSGLLVSIRWKMPLTTIRGAIQINGLVVLEQAVKGVNPFETVPPRWVKDRALVTKARNLVDSLPDNLRQLVCAILWDGVRFKLFCDRPTLKRDHHIIRNANLRLTVELGEMVNSLASQYPQADIGISLVAVLLHDVGKAAEYDTWSNGEWCMTDQCKRVGRRHKVLKWISEALQTNRIALPEKEYLSLKLAITSTPNTEWVGIQSSGAPETILLSIAEKLT